jgi:GNAT superfamily N-acetyltransferase
MNAQQVTIRPATEADLGPIAQVLVDTWRSTFRGRLPDAFLDGMSRLQQEERHRRTMGRPGISYAVAAVGPRIVGFANGGPNRQQILPQAGELYALYIQDGFQRQGIGTALFRAIVAKHRGHGRLGMFARVLADNPNRPFYRRLGGQPVAERPITLGPATVAEIAYAWDDLDTL